MQVGDQVFTIRALIDTGAEVNIIKKGTIPPHYMQRDNHPLTLKGADDSQLTGGNLCLKATGMIEGKDIDSKEPIEIHCPLHMYEANITVQAILSYKWLADQNFMVHPRRHGLFFQDESIEAFVPGITVDHARPPTRLDKVVAVRLDTVPMGIQPQEISSGKNGEENLHKKQVETNGEESNPGLETEEEEVREKVPMSPENAKIRMQDRFWKSGVEERFQPQFNEWGEEKPRMLDLFSGTGSIAKAFRARGYQVITLDNLPKFGADICMDILAWDYLRAFPRRYFKVIAASPPCTEYSVAMTCRPRELDKADELVGRAMDIIHHYMPEKWFLENPRTGHLKGREVLRGLEYVDVDYCQFCEWGYKKPTRIWGSAYLAKLKPRLCDNRACINMYQRPNGGWGHRRVLGATPPPGVSRVPLEEQYRIPEGVIAYVMGWGRQETDWIKPLIPHPPFYPPPPLPSDPYAHCK